MVLFAATAGGQAGVQRQKRQLQLPLKPLYRRPEKVVNSRNYKQWIVFGPFDDLVLGDVSEGNAGDPLALTVNYCAPVTQGTFDLDIRLVKANRSSQHWSVEMTQGNAGVVTLATAVFAERRPSWSHQPAEPPQASPFERTLPYPSKIAASWVKQYDFRFLEGEPKFGSSSPPPQGSAESKMWIADRAPRKIDALSLMSMSDAFFARIFHVRREQIGRAHV